MADYVLPVSLALLTLKYKVQANFYSQAAFLMIDYSLNITGGRN